MPIWGRSFQQDIYIRKARLGITEACVDKIEGIDYKILNNGTVDNMLKKLDRIVIL